MIDIKEVIDFFDNIADKWDEMEIRSDEVINKIMDNGGIEEGVSVLDVACGTGTMIPDYLKRNVAKVTAIDVSPKMAEIAERKFGREDRVDVICGDAENDCRLGNYDRIMIYNAFPHFADPEKLIKSLSARLNPGGMLSVAHGQSREKTDSHHKGSAKHISDGLPEAEDVAKIFSKFLRVTVIVSDEKMYQVVGIK